jgi:hypothetical protein
VSTGAQFSSDITKWCVGAKASPDIVLRKILTAMSAVIIRTPIDTGHAQANWQLTEDSIPDGELEGTTPADVSGKIAAAKCGHIHYFTNTAPYIWKLEYGGYAIPGGHKTVGGFSTQAPAGMMRITMIDVRAGLE